MSRQDQLSEWTTTVSTLEQRLHEWCLDAPQKAGQQRTDLDARQA